MLDGSEILTLELIRVDVKQSLSAMRYSPPFAMK